MKTSFAMKKKLLKAVEILLLLLQLSCNKTKESKTTLLLDWVPNVNHIPLIVGIEKGFFLDQTIDLDLKFVQDPPSVLSYLSATNTPLGIYYYPSALHSSRFAKNFKIIGKLFDEPLIGLLCKNYQINGSKLVTYADPFSIRLIESLQSQGVNFSSIHISHLDLLTHFMFCSADTITSYLNAERASLEKKRIPYFFFTWKDLSIPSYPELVFIAKKSFLIDKPSFKNGFRKALIQSIQFCKANPKEALEIYLERFPEKKRNQDYEKRSLELTLDLFSTTQIFDEKKLEDFERWFFRDENPSRSFMYKKILEN